MQLEFVTGCSQPSIGFISSAQFPADPMANRHRILLPEYGSTPAAQAYGLSSDCPSETGIAKFEPPNSRTMAKLIPMTLPSLLKSGPPDPPEVVWAS